MRKSAVYGVGQGINGREAAMQATQQALDQFMGAARPVLGLVFVAQEFDTAEVVNGVLALLGDVPLWGFSTIRPITDEGDQPRSVVVGLLAGSDLKAQVRWWSNYSHESASVARQAAQTLRQESFSVHESIFVADGINSVLEPLCLALKDALPGVVGCMAAGEQALGKTYQIGRDQSGPGSLSMALLGGKFRLGVGISHGWRSTGIFFRATRTRDVWLQSLDGAPAVDSYARYFGHTSREWASPPLTDITRLYPLGVELEPGGEKLLLRSALRVEVDGSLRMSAPVPEGAVVHLMIGDPEACLQEAQVAAQHALDALGPFHQVRPLMALALVDVGWSYLFESRPAEVAAALKVVLGDVPLVGAYTLGQIIRTETGTTPVIHNQNISIVIIGEQVEP